MDLSRIRYDRVMIRRTTAFIVALMGMAISGTLYAFSAFEPAFKKTFGYDQSEGQGSTITYMACLMTTINNYPLRLRGTVVGCVDAMYGGSAAIFAGIYAGSFVNGHDNGDEEKQNLKGFFLMCAIVIVIVNILAMIFLKLLPPDEEILSVNVCTQDSVSTKSNDSCFEPDKDTDDAILGDMGGFSILINLDFQYIFWIANIGGGVGLTYMNNVSSILESFHLGKDNGFLSTLTPVASCVARIIAGYVSDRLIHRVPRATILLFWLILLAVMQFISMFFLGSYAVLVLNSIVIGASFGSIWCLTPTMISELFGTRNFGWNWGWMMLSTATGTIVYQRVFAAIYQFYIRPGDGLTCYGLKCYRWTFMMAAVTAVYSIILTIRLIQRINDAIKRKKSRRGSVGCRNITDSNKHQPDA
ncbi:Protein NUCLEAR FUSION DEFECTIVE 4 [Trichoplax sp. H2]|nr:Protein NUCLEAR FUSION DEFECTIVE 4 [Trichoplax sp. H2]|eukprot:RDD40074.1 Protein NUCLEAR FUSION DEFECTIVE 4 [Trichoplax sp. H2]